jgi:hypothetical protein
MMLLEKTKQEVLIDLFRSCTLEHGKEGIRKGDTYSAYGVIANHYVSMGRFSWAIRPPASHYQAREELNWDRYILMDSLGNHVSVNTLHLLAIQEFEIDLDSLLIGKFPWLVNPYSPNEEVRPLQLISDGGASWSQIAMVLEHTIKTGPYNPL